MKTFPFEPPRKPMEARTRETIPDDAGWAFEPKWDGFRALAWAPDGAGEPRLDSRNRKPLLRYFPELVDPLSTLPSGTVVDGETVIVTDGQLDFDALSNRIHPAESRIDKLAVETPAELVCFDLLALDGEDLRGEPFARRREALVGLAGTLDAPWHLTPSTDQREVGERWFHEFESAGCDGLVCKRLDGSYVEGKREMRKVKHRRTVDAVVAGYRVHKNGPGAGIGSLLLGLHDGAGALHYVGHCSNFTDEQRVELYERLQELRVDGGGAFGDQARQPGEPSRWRSEDETAWVPLRPALVCEVSYTQLTARRFRHATRFERWRPDKDPEECTFAQLDRPEGPDFAAIVA